MHRNNMDYEYIQHMINCTTSFLKDIQTIVQGDVLMTFGHIPIKIEYILHLV